MTRSRIAIGLALLAAGCDGTAPASDTRDAATDDAASPNAVDAPVADAGPSPTAATHVLTWDYYDNAYGAPMTDVPVATAAAWLSWSDSSAAASTALASFDVKSYLYSSPTGLEGPTDEFYSALVESDFAHDCNALRVTVDGYNGYDVTDPRSSTLAIAWKQWVGKRAGTFAAIFMEGADIAFAAVSAPPCNVTLAEWQAAELTMIDAVDRPVMFNGLWPTYANGKFSAPTTLPLLEDPNVIGARMEGCYIEPSNPSVNQKVFGDAWVVDENTELTMARKGKVMLCMSGFNAPVLAAATALDQRAYAIASFLLSYDPATTLLGEGFTTPSQFHVEPESEIVALDPLVAAPADVSALDSGGGVYVREYASCYVHGKRVSACAAIVNPSATLALAFPATRKTYAHTMVLAGGGVLDGGTVSVTGPAPPRALAPVTGMIVFE